MISFILFLIMCFSMVFISVLGLWSINSLWWQRLGRLGLVVVLLGIFSQYYVLNATMPEKVAADGVLSVPVGWGMNLFCCLALLGIVRLIRWIWTGK